MKNDEDVNLEDCFARLKVHFGVKTDKELAQELGMSAANLSNYKKGKGRSIPYKWLIFVAKKIGRSVDWVLYGKVLNDGHWVDCPDGYCIPRRIPVLSMSEAGKISENIGMISRCYADENIWVAEACGLNTFAFKIKGDLMEPRFREGEVILIDPSKDYKSGDFVLVKDGNDTVFRQLVIDGKSVFLKPFNPRYPIKNMTGLEYKIIGKAFFKQERLH